MQSEQKQNVAFGDRISGENIPRLWFSEIVHCWKYRRIRDVTLWWLFVRCVAMMHTCWRRINLGPCLQASLMHHCPDSSSASTSNC